MKRFGHSSGILQALVACVGVACSSSDGTAPPPDGGAATPFTGSDAAIADARVSPPRDDAPAAGGSCEGWASNLEGQCPALGEQSGTALACTEIAQEAADVGCAGAWNAYVACESSGTVDCKAEDVLACGGAFAAFKTCQTSAAQQNPCVRVQGADSLCESTAPKAWGCVGGATRPGCVAARDSGSTAAYYCCP